MPSTGLPSLYLFAVDNPVRNRVKVSKTQFGSIGEVDSLEIKRGQDWVPVVKLWQLAQVRQGLATADDLLFTRKTPGVIPNARRRNIVDVDLRCTIEGSELGPLTADEKNKGIQVIDPQRDKYFVPFDKGGEQDTAAGELREFWSPVDYWIDWSESSVSELEKRNKFKPGTPKKPRLQNRSHYFKKGIRFSPAGIYAPTFESSFGGVFGHKGSLIIPFNQEISNYILAILCSPMTRYITKNFLQIGIMTEIDIIRQIPIVVPTKEQFDEVNSKCEKIMQYRKSGDDYSSIKTDLWLYIFNMYRLDEEDQKEISTWFKRRYPNFGKARDLNATS